jgi:hypothetical protein
VYELLTNFRRIGPEALLFLKHIRTIKIYELENDESELKLLYRMSARTESPEVCVCVCVCVYTLDDYIYIYIYIYIRIPLAIFMCVCVCV